MPNKIIVAVQKSDFDLNFEMETLKLKTEKAGAVVFFVGKVRDLEDDNLKYLEIESFEELARDQIKEICENSTMMAFTPKCTLGPWVLKRTDLSN